MPRANVIRLPRVPALSWDDCRLLVECVVDYAIFMLDTNGYVATWNPGAEKIKGYAAHEIVGEHFSRFYLPEDVEAGKPDQALAAAAELGRSEDEGWRVRKDGSRFWASVVLTALHDESGKLRGFGKVTRDLTVRRAAEERLKQAEERFHHLVDAIGDYAVFMLDADGRVATWNPGARRLKGYTSDEIVGRHFSVFYTPEERAAGRPDVVLQIVRREGRFEDEGWRTRKDGGRFWANVVITALRDDRGHVVGFAKVTRDLTERRAAEEQRIRDARDKAAREASIESLRLLVDHLPNLAFTAMPDGDIDYFNQRWFDYTGSTLEQMAGRGWERSHDPAMLPEVVARWRASLASGEPFEMEHRLRGADGSFRWFLTRVEPLCDSEDRILRWIGTSTDIDALKRSEEENVVTRQKLEEAVRAKDEFLATVSHELRTPLHAIVGWAALLRGKELPPEVARPVEVIHRNAQAQMQIVETILDASQIITGSVHLDPRPVDLVDLTRDAIEAVRPSASAKRIVVDLLSRTERSFLLADPERLHQAVWNLLSNAVKFTAPGGWVRVVLGQEGSSMVLSVSDSGQGIEPGALPFVFDRFWQADRSITRRVGGLGLGLALVRYIVEAHGGEVSAASEGFGKGSTFIIRLPVGMPSLLSDADTDGSSGT